MILTRSFDAAAVNALVNAPEVRPFVGGQGALDLAAFVAQPEHRFLLGEHGGFAMTWSAPRVYEVHTFILAGGRGAWARQAARDAIDIMRDHAHRLWTKISAAQGNVIAFAEAMGMLPTGMTVETLGKPYGIYEIEIG